VPYALARSLLLADAVTPEALAQALLVAATRGTSLVRALVATRAVDPSRLEQILERGETPYMRHVAPVTTLVSQLPQGLCHRLLALPVRHDARTGTVDVAVVDVRDSHAVEEIAHWLRAPVRTVRTSLASMEAALRRMSETASERTGGSSVKSLAPPIWVPSPNLPPREFEKTPSYGHPSIDASSLGDPGIDGGASFSNDHDIPIPLTRKSIPALPAVAIIEIGLPAVERDGAEPVLDLRRKKASVDAPSTVPMSGGPPSSGAAPTLPRGAPSTSRGPFPPNAPVAPFEDIGPMVDEIRRAEDRDRIIDLLVSGVRTVARRVAVLAAKRDAFTGWTCTAELGDKTAFRGVRLPANVHTVFKEATTQEGAVLVRMPKDGTHAPLLGAMKGVAPGEVALVAVRVEGKPAAVVMADETVDSLVLTQRMEKLAREAGDALARLLRERRKA
jgi:hypothetical protein